METRNKIKFGFIFIALMFTANMLFGQTELEIRARNHMHAKEFDKAKPILDEVSEDPQYIQSSEYWYLKGFLYKELYKRDQMDDRKSPYRDMALEFYEKSMELDADGSKKNSNVLGIKYLGIRCFNDAASSLDPINYKSALVNFDKYLAAMKLIGTGQGDLKDNIIQFKLALASSVYTKLYEAEEAHDQSSWENSVATYKDVLAMDLDNLSANYNLGILFYNRAVDIIMNEMKFNVGFMELDEIQERCINLFKEALPYLLRAHGGLRGDDGKIKPGLDPANRPVIEGLAGIYFSLNEIEKSNYYKELYLEKLQNNKVEEPLKIVEEHRQEHDWYNWKD